MIADGAERRDARVRSSYDAVATAYADHLVDELRGLPFETWLLDRVLAHAAGQPVVEVGSGPGHVTAYLADGGADATGIDLSPAMVAEARRRFPGRTFEVGRPAAAEPSRRRAPGGRPCWGGTRSSTWRPPSCPTRSRPWSARLPPAAGWSSRMHAGAEVRHLDELVRPRGRPRLRAARAGVRGRGRRGRRPRRHRVVPPRARHRQGGDHRSACTSSAASPPSQPGSGVRSGVDREGMSGGVVGVPALALEGQEDRRPLAWRRGSGRAGRRPATPRRHGRSGRRCPGSCGCRARRCRGRSRTPCRGSAASGPHRSPNAYTRAAGSAAARLA